MNLEDKINQKTIIKIGKRTRTVEPIEHLRKELEQYSLNNEIIIKKLPNKLKIKLKTFAKQHHNNWSIIPVIELAGFKPIYRKGLSDEEINNIFKQAIPKKEAEELFKNPKKIVLESRFKKIPNGMRAWTNYSKSKTNREIINNLYPELKKKYGNLYDKIVKPDKLNKYKVSDWLEEQFFKGNNISPNGLKKIPHGISILNYIKNNPIKTPELNLEMTTNEKNKLSRETFGEIKKIFEKRGKAQLKKEPVKYQHIYSTLEIIKKLKLDKKKFQPLYELINSQEFEEENFKKIKPEQQELIKQMYNKAVTELFTKKPNILFEYKKQSFLSRQIINHLQLKQPKIRPYDVFSYKLYNGLLGRASQGEVSLFFALYNKYATKEIKDEMKELIGEEIRSIEINEFSDLELRLTNNNKEIIPDLRIITDKGDFLIEVKRQHNNNHKKLEEMINKYHHFTKWSDGKQITKKITIHTENKSMNKKTKQFLKMNGWEVIDGTKFNKLYKQLLTNMKNNYENEFLYTKIPLAGTKEEVFEKLETIRELISDKPHQITRLTNTRKLKFINSFLNEASISISQNKKYTEFRKEYSLLKKVYETKLEELQKIYEVVLRTDFDSENQFFDLETNSFLHQGGIIGVSSNLSKDENGQAIIKTYIARDPMEEKDVVLGTLKDTDFKTLIGVNSKSFDMYYLLEACYSNYIKPPIIKHEDLLNEWKKIAKPKRFPREDGKEGIWVGLKAFEKYFLRTRIRQEDIPGNEIPEIMNDFWNGRIEKIDYFQKIITHCILDIASTSQLKILINEGEQKFLERQITYKES